MNMTYRLIPLALGAILSASPALSAGPNGRQTTTPILAELNAEEAATLSFMREEERLARDVYLTMDGLWSLPPFLNIAQSEQQHMDRVKDALDRYGLDDPSDVDAIGVYADGSLQALHAELVTSGERSYVDALKVGALIEEVDIQDLEGAIAATDNQDLQMMYDNLMRGSRNHLRAFVAEIERQGLVYEAQVLDQTALDEILDTPMERGGNAGGQAGSKRSGMGGANARQNQAFIQAPFDHLIARGGNGDGTGAGKGKRRGQGTYQG